MIEQRRNTESDERADAKRQAAAWIARLDAHPSAELIAQFEAWKGLRERHREAAERLADLWSELDALGELRTLAVPADRRRAESGRFGAQLKQWGQKGLAAAAAVAITVFVATAAYRLAGSQAPPTLQTYETALGKQRLIDLADGSTVQLNTNSAMEVRFTRGARDVRLVRGEAFFEVAPDRSRPFNVESAGGRVRAVGTAFDVRVDRGDVRVILTKGVVWLSRTMRAPSGSRTPAGLAAAAILNAQSGRPAMAVITQEGIRRETVNRQQVTRELSWRHGVLVFDGEPLSEVVADVSRYTDVRIEIADPSLRNVRISGYFDIGDVNSMLDALQSSFGVRVERLDPTHVRLTAARE